MQCVLIHFLQKLWIFNIGFISMRMIIFNQKFSEMFIYYYNMIDSAIS